MILELASLEIKENQTTDFEKAFEIAQNKCLKPAKGYIKHNLVKGIENPNSYKIFIYWETLDSHIIDFRESNAFVKWREIIGVFFAKPPVVFHYDFK